MNNLTNYAVLYGLLSFITVLLSSLVITRMSKPAGCIDTILFCFTAFTGQVLLMGYTLSAINSLNRLEYWIGAGILLLGIILFTFISNKKLRQSKLPLPQLYHLTKLKTWYLQLTRFEKFVLSPLITVTILTGIINLIMIIFTAPHNWDSMTYHLARAAYYIQHGSLDYYDANFWAQVVHPKNSTVLIIYTFLITGLNENLSQIIQFGAYWIATLSVYGISRRSRHSATVSLFLALIFALLIETLMEAATTQNDLLLTAYIGIAVYCLFAFKRSQNHKYLFWAGINLGIAFGVKATALLVLPALLIVFWYTLKPPGGQIAWPNVRNLLLSATIGIIIFALPTGYWENYRLFGHPIGPENVRRGHSFESNSLNQIVSIGTKNVIRFGFDFLSLDGLPQVGPVLKVQNSLRAVPVWLARSLNTNLETAHGVRAPFEYQRVPRSHEDGSYWGILGFGMIWIIVLLSAMGVIKEPAYRVLSIAAIVFWITQAYSGPYDPWRGRYFITAALFATPPVGWLFYPQRSQLVKIYVVSIILLGALSAFTAVALRPRSMLFTLQYKTEIRQSVFNMDRLTQLTRNPEMAAILHEYENHVPPDATVAVYLEPDRYEYPLFGKKLTRTLIPLNSFWKGPQPIPEKADYLVFSGLLIEPTGKDKCTETRSFCLRKLHEP